jgi:hypothetical protein
MDFQHLPPGFDVLLNVFLVALVIVWGMAFYMFSLDKSRTTFVKRFRRDKKLKYTSACLVVFGSIVVYQAFFN